MSDDEIFKIFKDNSFTNNTVFLKAKEISLELDNLSCHSLLERIIKE